jgi:hypothetical protein
MEELGHGFDFRIGIQKVTIRSSCLHVAKFPSN